MVAAPTIYWLTSHPDRQETVFLHVYIMQVIACHDTCGGSNQSPTEEKIKPFAQLSDQLFAWGKEARRILVCNGFS